MNDKCSKAKLNQEIEEQTPGEQLDAYSAPTQQDVEEAVKELNDNGPEHLSINQ